MFRLFLFPVIWVSCKALSVADGFSGASEGIDEFFAARFERLLVVEGIDVTGRE